MFDRTLPDWPSMLERSRTMSANPADGCALSFAGDNDAKGAA